MMDFVSRIAVNPVKALHVDVGGVLRVFRHTVSPVDAISRTRAAASSINARYQPEAATKLLLQCGFGPGPRPIHWRARSRRRVSPRQRDQNDPRHVLDGRRGAADLHRLALSGYYSGVDADATFDVDSEAAPSASGFRAHRSRTTGGFRKSPRRGPMSFWICPTAAQDSSTSRPPGSRESRGRAETDRLSEGVPVLCPGSLQPAVVIPSDSSRSALSSCRVRLLLGKRSGLPCLRYRPDRRRPHRRSHAAQASARTAGPSGRCE